jgi:hypothetical protein
LKSNLDRHLTKISGELIVQRPSDESRVAKEVEIKDKVTSIKEELLLKQRTFRAEWEAERDSEPLNINVGKNILMRFGAELHEFRPSLDGIVDDQSLSRMDKIFRMTKSIQKYLVHADGGLSFKKFWQEGNNIFEQAKFAIDGISSLEKVS